jgi:Glycosyltransferase family 87
VSRAASAAVTAVAVFVLLLSWSLLHHGTLAKDQITDTGLYEQYGDAIADGRMPYRDFQLEYPPAALPVFVLPALGHAGDRAAYDRWFDREMALCACLLLVGVALSLRALRAPPLRFAGALALVAFSPLLLGSVVLTRFDMWPAALVALALAALLWERLWLAAPLLGLAIGAKLWPLVLLPLAVLWLRGRRAWWFAGGVAAVVAAVFVPFAVIAPDGVWHSLDVQLSRPLQLESTGGAVLIAFHHLFGTGLEVVTTYGSQNIAGTAAEVIAVLTSVLLVVSLLLVWRRFARSERTAEGLVCGCAASVALLLALGKVFSPQFVIWLLPVVPLVANVTAWLLLALVLVLTQSWFPRHYWDLANGLRARESFELFVRDALVVALAYVSAASSSRASSGESARSGARTSS